jgi:predicted MFS family arabinose efflux permease
MLPTVIAGPLAGGVLGRFRGERVLVSVHLVRAAAAGIFAATLAVGGPGETVFLWGAVVAGATAFVRPIQFALVPAVVRSPGQLVAANVATSAGEGLGTLLGPALGGLLVGLAGPAVAFAFVGSMFLAAAIITATIDVRGGRRPGHAATQGIGATLRTGVANVRARRGAQALLLAIGAQTFVRGVLTVLIVVLSIELLGLGDAGVGALNAAIGVGGLIGGLLAVGLAGRRYLGPSFAVSLSVWGLPIALIAIWPVPAAAFVLLFVIGIANAALDIAGFTLLQRILPNAARGAVFGLMEGLVGLSIAAGAGVAPFLIDAFGIEGALGVTGAVLPIVAVALWPAIARADRDAVVPEEAMRLLRGIPMFAPLPMTVIEQLAGSMEPTSFAAGEVIMREGEPGDTFVMLTHGRVEVSVRGESLATLGPGDGIGEIAVLRRVPRTATVRALEAVEGQALSSVAFVAAVSGSPASVAAADTVVAGRLATGAAGYA